MMVAVLDRVTAAADVAAGALVMGALESVVLLCCVTLCVRLLPGLSAAMRSVVWTATLLLAAALPVLPLLLAVRGGAAMEAAPAALPVAETWGLGLVGLWAALSLWRAVMLTWSALRLRGIAQRAMPVEAGAECAAILAGEGAGRRSAALCLSADVDRPSVAGFFHPRVLLPAKLFARLTPVELVQIVRHEMEHLHRGDDWTNLLQKLSLAAFPLNPVLVWLDRRLSLERELACDDGVLRKTRARKAYAACLTTLAELSAESSMARRGASLALGAWGRRTELVLRVHRILGWREGGLGRRPAFAVTGVLLLSVTAGTAVLARSPQLVRFSPAAPIESAEHLEVPPALRTPGLRDVSVPDDGATTRPTLVKAVMPEVRNVAPMRTGLSVAKGRRRADRRMVSRVSASWRQRPASEFAQPWVRLTGWRMMPSPPRLAVADDDSLPKYAAVRMSDGWLIFQL